ncbi:MAG: pyridoxal-phosphate dependent enzyme [Acidimicrobiia bacterium]
METNLKLGLAGDILDATARDRAVARFREARIALPTFSELADPARIPGPVRAAVSKADPHGADPLNLYRVHWHNTFASADQVPVPDHVVLPPAFTGVDAPIVVLFGNRFPMIAAHKVLAAYACLVPRVVTGQFDPHVHRAVWPSTGNYARGGVAISRIMGCRGVAVLPENMSRERFEWLERWVADPGDVIRTPGSESNVKEIYDACAELSKDPTNVILNQFCEFANHLGHFTVTGRAIERVVESIGLDGDRRIAGFVSSSGSAGTLAAGDYLKDRHGASIVAVEALECPTMLYNGYGEHNIQGIGDKHIPLIHNVTNTDIVVGVSDVATDHLGLAFSSPEGIERLRLLGVGDDVIAALPHFGLSSICNILAAIKVAKLRGLGPDDIVTTVATDGAALYGSERERLAARAYRGGFGSADAAAVIGQHLCGADTSDMLELDTIGRNRIFNLGYFTWVEQQGVDLPTFDARRDQSFWRGLRDFVPVWDSLIDEFNGRTGVLADLV